MFRRMSLDNPQRMCLDTAPVCFKVDMETEIKTVTVMSEFPDPEGDTGLWIWSGLCSLKTAYVFSAL